MRLIKRKGNVARLLGAFLAFAFWCGISPKAAADTPELVLKGHKGETLCVAFSPDGKTIATGGVDGKVRLWEVAGGKEKAVFQAGAANAVGAVRTLTVAFAAEGKLLLASSEYYVNDDGLEIKKGTVQAWDLASKQRKYQIDCLWAPFLAATANGKVFAYDNGTRKGFDVILCDGETGKKIATLPNIAVGALAISSDGSLLAAETESGVEVWDTAGPKRLARTRLPASEVAFSPDGKMLAVSADDVKVLDLDDLDKILVRDASEERRGCNPGGRGCLKYSPDGKLLALALGGYEKTAGLKEEAAADWGCVKLLELWWGRPGGTRGWHGRIVGSGRCGRFRCIAFSPDGKLLATVGNEEEVRLWKTEDE